MQIADTHEAAREAVRAYDAEIFKNLYLPLLPKGRISFDENDPAQSLMDSGPPDRSMRSGSSSSTSTSCFRRSTWC